MAVVPGGTKLCTRRNFNSNVASYFTNDDKVLTRREIGIGSFTVGNYKYTLSSSVTNLDTCMTCGNITYTKTSTSINYTINITGGCVNPSSFSRYGTSLPIENQGGGQVEMYDMVHVIAYSNGGTRLFDQDVSVVFMGEYNVDMITFYEAYVDHPITFTAQQSDPCSYLEMTNINYYPIMGISTHSVLYLNGATSKDWTGICYEIDDLPK